MVNEKASYPPSRHHESDLFAASAPHGIEGRIVCIGGAALDTTFLAQRPIVAGSSNPATGTRSFGGVARNVAENLARLGVGTGLISRVGNDENGRRLIGHLDGLGVETCGIDVVPDGRTADYVAVLEPDRNLAVGVADMAIFDRLDGSLIDGATARFDADWIFIDCNCAPALLEAVIARAPLHPAKVAVDAVSVTKSERLPQRLDGIDLLFLNLDEAAAILRRPRPGLVPRDAMSGLRQRGAAAVVLTLGAAGLLAGDPAGGDVHIAPVAAEVADVTGAGDALVATTLSALLAGLPLPLAARWGCLAATLTLERVGSTRPDLSFPLLQERARALSSPSLATSA